jgi:IS1 family transposase
VTPPSVEGKASVANVLAAEKRLAVLAALVDGNSVRATERMTGVNLRTILRFGVQLGEGAQHLHNRLARDLSCSLIENDEIWSYVGKKQARVSAEESAAGLGEAYTFVALAMPSRFVITWKVGKRDEQTADEFVADLRARLVVMPAMTSDGFAPYVPAIGKHMGPGVDYAQVIKNYSAKGRRDDDHRYEPPRDPFITKRAVFGAPNVGAATTAHIERQNGTMRHFIGRMRRLVYAFSKKPENHRAAVALAYCYYNLCWIPKGLRVTPAMAAGVVDHVWELREFMDAVLSAEPCDTPERKPLAPRKPEGPARELPNGRGLLRLVGGASAPAEPSPAPVPPPVAPAVQAPAVAPVEASADATGQLDLFAWKPRPRQLSLFGEPDGQ